MSFGSSLLAIGGKIALSVEGLKNGEIEEISYSKEEALKHIGALHDLISKITVDRGASTKEVGIFPGEDLVNRAREAIGAGVLPEGVYEWKGKEQIEGLIASLQTKIEDIGAQTSIYDVDISSGLENLKQMLEALRKMVTGESDLISSINRKSSKNTG